LLPHGSPAGRQQVNCAVHSCDESQLHATTWPQLFGWFPHLPLQVVVAASSTQTHCWLVLHVSPCPQPPPLVPHIFDWPQLLRAEPHCLPEHGSTDGVGVQQVERLMPDSQTPPLQSCGPEQP
jgi:hypothetical protein